MTWRPRSVESTWVTSTPYPVVGRSPAKTATTISAEKSTGGGAADGPTCRAHRPAHSSRVRTTVSRGCFTRLTLPRATVTNETGPPPSEWARAVQPTRLPSTYPKTVRCRICLAPGSGLKKYHVSTASAMPTLEGPDSASGRRRGVGEPTSSALPVDAGAAGAADEAVVPGEDVSGHQSPGGVLRAIDEPGVAFQAAREEIFAAGVEGEALDHLGDLRLDLRRVAQKTPSAGQAGQARVPREQGAGFDVRQLEEVAVLGKLEVERVVAHGPEPAGQLAEHDVGYEAKGRRHGGTLLPFRP